MSDYSSPLAAMREQVKAWRWEAEKKMREAKECELVASTIRHKAVDLDLLADKIEHALSSEAQGEG